MDAAERRAGKLRLLSNLRAGHRWPEAAWDAGVASSARTVFRLRRRIRLEGEAAALQDGRQGHASKLTAPVQQWLVAYCRGAPDSSGAAVQAALGARFGVPVSVSQINRVRAKLGVSRRAVTVGGKSGATAGA